MAMARWRCRDETLAKVLLLDLNIFNRLLKVYVEFNQSSSKSFDYMISLFKAEV